MQSQTNGVGAQIIISRNSPKDIQMRDLYLFVDGHPEITLEYGEMVEIEQEVGNHSVRVTNRVFSQKVEFALAEGETARFEVANVAARGLLSYLMMLVGTVPYKPTIRQIAP